MDAPARDTLDPSAMLFYPIGVLQRDYEDLRGLHIKDEQKRREHQRKNQNQAEQSRRAIEYLWQKNGFAEPELVQPKLEPGALDDMT